MKTNQILVLVLLLFIQNLANAGNMAEIYEFVINDCYKQQIMDDVLSENAS